MISVRPKIHTNDERTCFLMNNNNIKKGSNQGEILVDVSASGKERRWCNLKESTLTLSDICKRIGLDTFDKKAFRLEQCATDLEFKYSESSGKKSLVKANFCHIRLCPMCAWRRSMKIYANMSRIMGSMPQKEYAFIFLTLTVKNPDGEHLNSAIDDMMLAWKRFTLSKAFKSVVLGWYRGLEITHNIDLKSESYDTYHPHFHCILAVKPSYFKSRGYLSQEKWTDLWKRSLKAEYDPIVNVKRVKGNTADSVCEVAKYTVKSNDYIIPDDLDLSEQSVICLDGALTNRRLIAYGGIMKDLHKKLNLDDEMDGDLIHTDDEDKLTEEDVKLIRYVWNVGLRNYYIQ